MDPRLIARLGLPQLRLFKLARDLGLTPKDVVEIAAKIGILVKNSALSTVTYEERDGIVAYLNDPTNGNAHES